MFDNTKLLSTSLLILLFYKEINTINLIQETSKILNAQDIILSLVRKNNLRSIVLIVPDKHISNEFFIFLKSRSEPKYVINLERNAGAIGKMEDNILYMLYARPNQSVTRLYDKIRILKFWKPRNRLFVFKDDITIKEIISTTKAVVSNYWAVNIFYWINGTSFVRYNSFNQTTLTIKSDNVIGDICHNLYGTKLVAAMVDSLTASWNGSHFVGRDGYMTDIILDKLNASLSYLRDQDYMGILRRVVDGSADVDYTYPHDQDNLIILIPTRPPKMEELMSNVPPMVWILLLVFSILFLVYVRLFRKIEISEIMLMCVNMFTSRTVRTLSIPHFKLFLIVMVIMIFYINAVIQGTLASLLTRLQYPKQMETIKEFRRSNYSITVERNYLLVLESTNNTRALLSRCKFVDMPTFFSKLKSCMDEAFITTDQIAAHVMGELIIKHKKCYYILKQHLFPNHMAFIMKYGTPLSNQVNTIIHRVTESGLLHYWKIMATPRIKEIGGNHPRKMKIESIRKTLIFLACGYVCAIIVFIFEIFYYSCYCKPL